MPKLKAPTSIAKTITAIKNAILDSTAIIEGRIDSANIYSLGDTPARLSTATVVDFADETRLVTGNKFFEDGIESEWTEISELMEFNFIPRVLTGTCSIALNPDNTVGGVVKKFERVEIELPENYKIVSRKWFMDYLEKTQNRTMAELDFDRFMIERTSGYGGYGSGDLPIWFNSRFVDTSLDEPTSVSTSYGGIFNNKIIFHVNISLPTFGSNDYYTYISDISILCREIQ